jgi:signal transduction histidine kinase
MKFLPKTLFGRMVLIVIGGMLLAQILGIAYVMQDRQRTQLQIRVTRAAQRAADLVRVLDTLSVVDRSSVMSAYHSSRVTVGKLTEISALPQSDPELTEDAEELSNALRQFIGTEHRISTSMRHVNADAVRDNGSSWLMRPGIVMQTAVALKDGEVISIRQEFANDQRQWIYVILYESAIRSVIVIVLLLIAVRWVTRPLSQMAQAAEELGANIERPPMPETGPTEVARAAHAFNRMQTRLVAFVKERAQALAAISHDLKTPITRMRLRTELLDDAVLREKFEKDLLEMETMVQSTLDFMRGAADEKIRPIDMMAMLESLADDFADMGRTVEISGNLTSPYHGKAQALRRCMQNLIANAVEYGSRAQVSAERTDQHFLLRVEDDGPGIPETELERVFEPFYRLEHSRNRANGGTGLGLSIAREIVYDHGGTITCSNRAEGGLRVQVVLPPLH